MLVGYFNREAIWKRWWYVQKKKFARPGGMQPAMRDTMWGGQVQKMVDANGVPKGMKQVLEERGINTSTMVAADMRVVLANYEDFCTEKKH